MREGTGLEGKVEGLAVTTFENFEIVMMFLLSFILGGVMAPLIIINAEFGVSILFITGIAVLIGATIIAGHRLTNRKGRYSL
ncbi:MAG: hypothetical protein ABEK59_05700 [Halobacteria archaeon]